jgi:hypothetical protein
MVGLHQQSDTFPGWMVIRACCCPSFKVMMMMMTLMLMMMMINFDDSGDYFFSVRIPPLVYSEISFAWLFLFVLPVTYYNIL